MDKIDIIKKIVNDNPNDSYSWYLLGLEYSELGLINDSIKSFSEALKICDDELKNKIISELAKLADKKNNINDSEPIQREDVFEEEGQYTQDNKENDEATNPSNLRVLSGGKNQDKVIEFQSHRKTINFSDVGGLEKLKDTIRMKIIKPFINPGLFDKFKKKIGGGIMLYGPPGCGKTFIARATAGEVNAKFIPVHITDILNPYIGVSEQNLRDIFDQARANKPSVLFFDEIDALGYNRAKSSSDLTRTIIDQLLTEIEGIESNVDKLLIIGATNMPWDVDPAFKRPGRFDKLVFVPPPDEEAREIIFRLKLTDKPIDSIDFKLLAKQTELYSGADIENIVEIATENVLSEILLSGNERLITTDDLINALQETKPSTIEWFRTVKNYIKYANQSGLYDDVEKYLSTIKKYI